MRSVFGSRGSWLLSFSLGQGLDRVFVPEDGFQVSSNPRMVGERKSTWDIRPRDCKAGMIDRGMRLSIKIKALLD